MRAFVLYKAFSYKTFIGAKPLRIRFNKVDGFIRAYNGTRYLVLFCHEKYDAIHNRITYLLSLKSGATYVISPNYGKFINDAYDSLHLEKTLTLHNVIILIKSVFNKDQNNYYHNIILEDVWIN